MLLADHHTHSICSPDASYPMLDMAKGAHLAGVGALCITDHCDFLSLKGEPTPFYDWEQPLLQFQEMQSEWGKHLDLTLGLEFGVGFLNEEEAKKVLSQPALDFVIGSVHNLSEKAGGKDFYCLEYATEEDCYGALDDYFASMQRLAESDCYDVLGHIIYPIRYMKGHYKEPINVLRYTDEIRNILRTAVEHGHGMEINTWKGQTLKEWIPILELYRECRGEIITVGSDAHAPLPIGAGIRESYAILKDLGFRYVANYHGRRPDFIKL